VAEPLPELAWDVSGGDVAITGFGRPFGIARDNAGRLYIPDMDLHAVARFDHDLRSISWLTGAHQGWSPLQPVARGGRPPAKQRTPGELNGPHSVAVRPDGGIWVVTYYLPSICRFDAGGAPVTVTTAFEGIPLAGPATGRLDRSGQMWVTEYGHHGVLVVSEEGRLIGSLGGGTVDGFSREVSFEAAHKAGAFDRPHMTTELSDGTFVVVDTWNHRLQRFDARGRWLGWLGDASDGWRDHPVRLEPSSAPAAFHAPVAIGDAGDGRFVVTDWGNNRLQLFDYDGRLISVEDHYGLDKPYDAQPLGNILAVADSQNARVLLIGAA
jgi:hypothetical protein